EIEWGTGAMNVTTLSDLAIGQYTVTVTDQNGCVRDAVISVEESENTLAITTAADPASCQVAADGTASVNITGGDAPYQIIWSTNTADTILVQEATTLSIADLALGDYEVTVIDANGCDEVERISVPEDNNITIATSKRDATCGTAPNGLAVVDNITGGSGTFRIEWEDGTASDSLKNLAPGTYAVTVIDNETGCTQSTSVTIQEDNDIAIAVDVAIDTEGIFGSLTANATGGTPEYTYVWCNDATSQTISGLIIGGYIVTVTDANGCERADTAFVNVEPEINIQPNCDGTAQVSIVTGGCTTLNLDWGNGIAGETVTLPNGTQTLTVNFPNGEQRTTTFEVNAPQLSIMEDAIVNASCEALMDGAATVSVDGGTAPYIYEWRNEAGELVGSTASVENLMAGTYTVLVTDSNDPACTVEEQITIAADNLIDISALDQSVCEGETVTLSVMNNNPDEDLNYEWSPAELFEGDTNTATPTFIGTADATVTVIATSASGCTKEETVNITFTEKTAPDVSRITFTESCLGFEVKFEGNGETNGYIWRFGDPNTSEDISAEGNPTYTYPEVGTYVVTLIPVDAAACQDTALLEVTVNGKQERAFDISGGMIVCGQETTTVSVDDTQLDVEWYRADDTDRSNPLGSLNSIELGAGEYIAAVMDREEGCMGEQAFTIRDEQPRPDLQNLLQICQGGTVAISDIVFDLDGGTLGWLGNDPTVIAPQETTTYTVEVDNGLCSFTQELTIEVIAKPAIGAAFAEPDTLILGGAMSTELGIDNPDGAYNYTWTDENGGFAGSGENPTVQPDRTTTYTVAVTAQEDLLGACAIEERVTVVVLDLPCDEPYIFMPNAFTPNGDNVNDVIRVRGPRIGTDELIDEIELEIYNRWGELVYDSDLDEKEEKAWDGTHLRTGMLAEGRVFGYTLLVRCIGGDTFSKRGNIILIR
ncbi:MAG: PKD domain-containing protein, partial [Bacteroidota bacterium]